MLGLLPITAETDTKKLQFFGRLCDLDSNYMYLTNCIFLTRLFSYMMNPYIKHRGFIQEIIPLLEKYNLYPVLTHYLRTGDFPSKSEWKRSVKYSMTTYHLDSRQQRMQADLDSAQLLTLCNGKSLALLWDIPSNEKEILLYKFTAKLWTLLDIPPENCTLCARPFTNVFEHLCTICPETASFRDAWWETVIEDFDISLAAELCGLPQHELYLFFLGARHMTSNLPDNDLPVLHLSCMLQYWLGQIKKYVWF
jgi:hypothetical protein